MCLELLRRSYFSISLELRGLKSRCRSEILHNDNPHSYVVDSGGYIDIFTLTKLYVGALMPIIIDRGYLRNFNSYPIMLFLTTSVGYKKSSFRFSLRKIICLTYDTKH